MASSAPAYVAEPIPGHGVHEQRLDHGARVKDGYRAVQHDAKCLICRARVTLCQAHQRPGNVRLSPLPLLFRELRQHRAGLRCPAESQQRQHEKLSRLSGHGVRRQQQTLQPLSSA